MSNFASIYHVCLVPDSQVEQIRERNLEKSNRGYIQDSLWRRISVTANTQLISIKLGNVGEEAAVTGYANCQQGCSDFKLVWDELDNHEGLIAQFRFEPLVVWVKIEAILAVLNEHRQHIISAMSDLNQKV